MPMIPLDNALLNKKKIVYLGNIYEKNLIFFYIRFILSAAIYRINIKLKYLCRVRNFSVVCMVFRESVIRDLSVFCQPPFVGDHKCIIFNGDIKQQQTKPNFT